MDFIANLIVTGLKEFGKLKKKKKIIVLFILLSSFTIGIGIPLAFSNTKSGPNQTPVIPTPSIVPIPASLNITVDNQTVEAGSTFSATLNIESPNQGVEAADFVIKFDPEYLKVATSSGGNFFRLYQSLETNKGRIGYSAIAEYVNEKFVIPQGKGILMNVTFKALKAVESTQISVDTDKTIIASGGINILDKDYSTILTIK